VRALAIGVVALGVCLAACQQVIYVHQDDGGTDGASAGQHRDGGATADGPGGAPSLPDAARITQQDAAHQSDASCGPGSGVYPCGPFGTGTGSTMANETLWGYYDTNGNGSVTDETGGSFDLARYYALAASGAKVLYLNVSAPWCSTCQSEAASLRSLYQAYHGRGVEFLSALWDLDAHSEAMDWAQYFNLPFAVADDSGPKSFAKYWSGSGVPMTIFVDLRTMKILAIVEDWDEARFEAMLEGYLSQS
jgi:hypothetical protein